MIGYTVLKFKWEFLRIDSMQKHWCVRTRGQHKSIHIKDILSHVRNHGEGRVSAKETEGAANKEVGKQEYAALDAEWKTHFTDRLIKIVKCYWQTK